jgi:hypothetical protein
MRLALLLLLAIPAVPAVAQVGHEPSRSPYRDIPYGQSLTAYASYFDGSGGSLGIGVHDGWMYGVRFQLRSNHFISFGLGVSYGPDLERNVVDPFAEDPANRITGPVPIRVWIPEALLQFNFTANKSWHRIAPYAGIGLGAGFSSTVPSDSIYRSSVRFVFTPYGGTRIFLASTVAIRLEARMPLYKISYPSQYNDGFEPIIGTGGEWVASGWFIAGLVFNFSIGQ